MTLSLSLVYKNIVLVVFRVAIELSQKIFIYVNCKLNSKIWVHHVHSHAIAGSLTLLYIFCKQMEVSNGNILWYDQKNLFTTQWFPINFIRWVLLANRFILIKFFTTFELIALKKHSKMNVFFFVLVKYTSQLMGYFVQSYNLIAVIGFTKVIYWHIIRLEKPFQWKRLKSRSIA